MKPETVRFIADNVERGSKRHLRRELSIGWALAIIAAELFVIVALIAFEDITTTKKGGREGIPQKVPWAFPGAEGGSQTTDKRAPCWVRLSF